MKVTYKANAKINLSLDILSRLENGYHSLFMIMQSVDLFDFVTVEKTASDGIVLTGSEKDIPYDERNTAYKAAKAFFEENGIDDRDVHIHIVKKIPFAAGLAGGSADAAAVIAALNDIYRTSLSLKEMCRIGVKVGADVPFCLTGGTCAAQNIGEVISSLPELKDCFIVLAKPEEGVSTGEAYRQFDSHSVRHLDNPAMLYAAANGDFDAICENTGNVFEQLIEVPDRVPIKKVMYDCGAKCACMSGSGPTVFGVFEDEKSASEALKALKEKYKDSKSASVYICKPASSGLVRTQWER